MTVDDAMLAVADLLTDLNVSFMVVGSYSSNFYGVARVTVDSDFVVQMPVSEIRQLADRLPPPLVLEPQLSFESVTGTTRIDIRAPDRSIHVELFLLSDDEHDQARFSRRVVEPYFGRQIPLPTPEDVIVTKLRWLHSANRRKDHMDIFGVIGVQQGNLDWPYIESWADRHGTRQLLTEIRASVPKF